MYLTLSIKWRTLNMMKYHFHNAVHNNKSLHNKRSLLFSTSTWYMIIQSRFYFIVVAWVGPTQSWHFNIQTSSPVCKGSWDRMTDLRPVNRISTRPWKQSNNERQALIVLLNNSSIYDRSTSCTSDTHPWGKIWIELTIKSGPNLNFRDNP